jgi:cyclopropane fatty-acyl-phospholipid synthase-like methyltransferase
MLQLICDRAQIADGQEILDLGCGWGSLSLYLAEKYPNSKITGLSNSRTQKKFIDSQKRLHGLENLNILTEDISDFDTAAIFVRIISIEMFEHIRNYEKLLAKLSAWMKPEGLLFVHIFTTLNTLIILKIIGMQIIFLQVASCHQIIFCFTFQKTFTSKITGGLVGNTITKPAKLG